MVPLIVYIYQSDYLLSSSVVVLSQPASVRVRQEVWVYLTLALVLLLVWRSIPPPHRILLSMVWPHLSPGRSGSLQCPPVEGT